MKQSRKTLLSRLKAIDCTLQSIVEACQQPVSDLTAFNASSNMENCDVDAPSYPDVYYHNGVGTYPQIGDTVYVDPQGETTLSDTIIVSDEPANLPIDLEGIVLAFNCE